jgi:hypothetical protein
MTETSRGRSAPAAVAHCILVALATASGCAQLDDHEATEPEPDREAQVANDYLENHSPATYNMQGGSAGYDSKWSTDIKTLIDRHDVLALQEAGPVPQGPPFERRGVYPTPVNVPDVDYYVRNYGTQSRPRNVYVYFMKTDAGGNRVNLAMVSSRLAAAVWSVPGSFTGSRPAFGIQIGRTVFWTVHALSGGGNDVAFLLTSINHVMSGSGYDYAVMGDFNRDPTTVTPPPHSFIYNCGQPTQQSGGELDYMVTSRDFASSGQIYDAHRMAGLSSDHYPVEFRIVGLRAAGKRYAVGNYANRSRGQQRVLAFSGSQANGTPITINDRNNSTTQQLSLVAAGDQGHYLIKLSSGKCIDIDKGAAAKPGDKLVQWDCVPGRASQKWYFYPVNGGVIIISSILGLALCIDDLTGSSAKIERKPRSIRRG